MTKMNRTRKPCIRPGVCVWWVCLKGVARAIESNHCIMRASSTVNVVNKQSHREGNATPLQYSCLEKPMDGGAWWAAVHGVTKSRTQLSDFTFTFHFHALGKGMATHSSVLAWRIPGTGEPGGLSSMGSHRVGHDLAAAAAWVSCLPLFQSTVASGTESCNVIMAAGDPLS